MILDPARLGEEGVTRVALLKLARDFPVDIAVTDAEYTARDMGDSLPKEGDCAFYASLLPEGHYAGRRADGARPFNALAKRRADALPKPSEKQAPLVEEPRERPRKRALRPRIFDFFWR